MSLALLPSTRLPLSGLVVEQSDTGRFIARSRNLAVSATPCEAILRDVARGVRAARRDLAAAKECRA